MDEGVRLPNRSRSAPPSAPAESVFVPSEQAKERRSRRGWWIGLGLLSILAIGAVVAMVYWPRLKPKPRDAVEKVAADYLDALVRQDEEAAQKLGTVEEPPGIGSYRDVYHQKARDHQIRGSFAPLAGLHKRIDGEFTYDSTAGRFTPKNALGIAGETLDALHAAKDEAKKSGMYEKMQSGDPNDIFDSAEQLGKVFEKLAETTLAPKRILPTYKMLVESAKPPLADDAKALALVVAEDPKQWNALLKRPFWTLKPDGPFIYDEAEVTATARDRLASLGDPPSRLRLKLVRFRLEGIDTGWKVVSARRVQPGDDKSAPAAPPPKSSSYGDERPSPGESPSYSTGGPSRPTREAPKSNEPGS
jgi:hypothetical protein